MAFYLVGLGLDRKSISVDALEIISACKKVYVENYTVNFPYKIKDLEDELGVKITPLGRNAVEDESLVEQAKDSDVALLVYGDSLSATTHMQLVLACRKAGIHYRIFPNASILTAIAQTGLQPYKFGKITSMPDWKEHTNKPKSFARAIKENESIDAHSLVLTDIGLTLLEALEQLKESDVTPEKMIVLSHAGTNEQKMLYDAPALLMQEEVGMPFCLIIPASLHFLESDALEDLKSELQS